MRLAGEAFQPSVLCGCMNRAAFSRAENKTSGLVGQTEILIGHLYNLIQS